MQATYAENDFSRKKYTSSIAWLVGILLFLLPFVEIRCNDAPFAQNTGLGLALGIDYKVTGQMRTFQNTFEDKTDTKSKVSKESGKQYVFALVALLLGLAGLVFSLMSGPTGRIQAVIGVLAALCLIALMIQLKMDVSDRTKGGADSDELGNQVKVTASFTAWYWLSLLSFLAAAFFGWRRSQVFIEHEHPPKHAPQLPIENPGDQSEFPKSASESEVG